METNDVIWRRRVSHIVKKYERTILTFHKFTRRSRHAEFLEQNQNNSVIIPPHSGDTDALVLSAAVLNQYKERVIIDNGTGKLRKSISLHQIKMSPRRCSALLGIHGNEYISSKTKSWKLVQKLSKFEECFANLGNDRILNDNVFQVVEEFISMLFGVQSK